MYIAQRSTLACDSLHSVRLYTDCSCSCSHPMATFLSTSAAPLVCTMIASYTYGRGLCPLLSSTPRHPPPPRTRVWVCTGTSMNDPSASARISPRASVRTSQYRSLVKSPVADSVAQVRSTARLQIPLPRASSLANGFLSAHYAHSRDARRGVGLYADVQTFTTTAYSLIVPS